MYYSGAHFGSGSGKIWLEDVACTSSNTKLLQCSSSPIGKQTCSHSEDAGVGCEGVLLHLHVHVVYYTLGFI